MPIIRGFFCFFILLIQGVNGYAQQLDETPPPSYIKSVEFKAYDQPFQFPVVGPNDRFYLSFDDLTTEATDYYYRISYFNHDWSPSTLFKNEYIQGMDNLRIDRFSSSFNTLQPYTHYHLDLPNENTRFLVPGNYMLEIYNGMDQLVFSRRFVRTSGEAVVTAGVFRARDLNFYQTHQSVQFSVTPTGVPFRNPENLIKIVVLQNDQWHTAVTDLKPQYNNGRTLEYRYDEAARFEGGNEYLFFDTKDIRVTSPNVSFVRLGDRYESFLFTDPIRNNYPYSYGPDINGDFQIRTLQGTQDPAVEADYSWVHFSLSAPYELSEGTIHVVGKFNDYLPSDENQLQYNASLEGYEVALLLKQGFYNYRYVIQAGDQTDHHAISGNHAQTENRYLVLVYYRNFGQLHDALIGVGTVSSFEVFN
ncbi:MAG: DUF5103 domain-containing protein [Flavobacteriaceae bacterium]